MFELVEALAATAARVLTEEAGLGNADVMPHISTAFDVD
jgi:hypothetical protein